MLFQARKDWIWNITLVSHNILGTESIYQSELCNSFDANILGNTFCIVNATVALHVEKNRTLFDHFKVSIALSIGTHA